MFIQVEVTMSSRKALHCRDMCKHRIAVGIFQTMLVQDQMEVKFVYLADLAGEQIILFDVMRIASSYRFAQS